MTILDIMCFVGVIGAMLSITGKKLLLMNICFMIANIVTIMIAIQNNINSISILNLSYLICSIIGTIYNTKKRGKQNVDIGFNYRISRQSDTKVV
jgi:hypothetical protein